MIPIKRTVSTLIITIHFGILVYILWQRPPTFSMKKRLVVCERKEAKIACSPPPKPQKTIAVKPVAKTITKKPVPKPEKKKQPVASKKQEPAPPPLIPKQLLNQLEESIAKIEKKSDNKTLTTTLTVPTMTKRIAKTTTEAAIPYQEKLIDCLHRALALPDHGEVIIELTLNSFGAVLHINVIEACSEKNKEYLKQHLPQVCFPPMEGTDAKKTQKTFRLAFYNEI